MSRINKKVAFFIVFLILVIIAGLFVKTPVDTKTQVNDELKVGGMYVQFEDGISDSEVNLVLKNYNLTMNYSIKYNIDHTADKYYIMLDKDNWDIRRELSQKMKEEKKIGLYLLLLKLSGKEIITYLRYLNKLFKMKIFLKYSINMIFK